MGVFEEVWESVKKFTVTGALSLSGTTMAGNCEGPLHKKLSLIFSPHVPQIVMTELWTLSVQILFEVELCLEDMVPSESKLCWGLQLTSGNFLYMHGQPLDDLIVELLVMEPQAALCCCYLCLAISLVEGNRSSSVPNTGLWYLRGQFILSLWLLALGMFSFH